MDFIASNEFGSLFYSVSGVMVLIILWRAYFGGVFPARAATRLMWVVVAFTLFYLGYRFGTGYTPSKIAEHANTNAWYRYQAAFHGIVSTWAIVQATVMFMCARKVFARGENYFRQRPRMTAVLALLWVILLLSFLVV
jgi:hypothetical protein